MNVSSTHITNVYVNKTVIVNNTTVNNVSYNGGAGGTRERADSDGAASSTRASPAGKSAADAA